MNETKREGLVETLGFKNDYLRREDIRNRAQENVYHGRWHFERADRLASRLGFAPYVTKPDPSQFDPMTRSTWNVFMVLAWICWRTTEDVCLCFDEYRAENIRWRGHETNLPLEGGKEVQTVIGWELQSDAPMSDVWLALKEQVHADRMIMSTDAAGRELWDALLVGGLIATAIEAASGRPVEIPALGWSHVNRNHFGELRFDKSDRIAYTDVKFLRVDVMKLWPATTKRPDMEAVAVAPVKKRTSQRAVKAVVAELIKKKPAATDADVQELAKSLGANREEVRAAWREAREKAGIPAKVGRPQKK